MKYLIFIVIGAFGIWIGRKLAMKNVSNRLSKINFKHALAKKEAKKTILRHLAETRQVSINNDDVQSLLNVSDSSATNYLQELVDEGKLEQIGESGKYISYKLK